MIHPLQGFFEIFTSTLLPVIEFTSMFIIVLGTYIMVDRSFKRFGNTAAKFVSSMILGVSCYTVGKIIILSVFFTSIYGF